MTVPASPGAARGGDWRVHAAMAASQVVFSTLPIAVKLVLPAVAPLGIVALRIMGGAVVFAGFKWAAGGERVRSARDLAALAGLALLGVVFNQVLFVGGVSFTSAVHANILVTTIPVFTLAVAAVLGRERLSAAKIAAILLAGSGALWLVMARGGPQEGASSAGDGMVALAALFYSAYLVLSKDLLRRYQPLTVITYVFMLGALLAAPIVVPVLLSVDAAALPARTGLTLAYIVAFPSFLAYLLSIWALSHTASSLVAMYVYLQPLVTAVTAPLVLGERVTARAAGAGLLIFAGLAIASRAERRADVAIRPPAQGV